jgi:tryptophan 2,3-dioxygenase
LEFALGKRSQESVEMHSSDSQAYKALQDAIAAPSTYELFLAYLKNKGYKIPDSAINIDRTQPTTSNPQIHPILVDIYHNDPARSQVCELLVDVHEGLQEWRHRHVKMVERIIGVKLGTGGSAGAAYLQTILFPPMFPDLWDVRSQF